MKTGWIAGAVLLGAAAGLLMLTRDGDDADRLAPDPLVREARVDRSDTAGGGARSGRAGGAAGASRARPWSGAPDDRASAPGGADRVRPGGAGTGAGGSLGSALGARPATEREAPKAGSTGPVVSYEGAANNPEQVADPIPEVAYDGGLEKIFPTDSQEQVAEAGPIAGGAGTVSFWLKPEWAPGDQNDATFIQFGDSGLEVMKNVSFLRFQYTDSAGVQYGLGASLAEWPPGQWRHVAASWVEGQLTFYVDGKMVSQGRYPSPPEFQAETKLYVGSAFASGAPASRASITSLRVLNRDAYPGEISEQFVAGSPPPR